MIRHILASIALVSLLSLPAAAQNQEIEAVISEQISAFQQDDFETAFGFASDNIRAIFGTPERFGAMVRQGYPMVYRPGSVRFGSTQTSGAGIEQKVFFSDQSGRIFVAIYTMIKRDNIWKIDGVVIVPAPQTGA